MRRKDREIQDRSEIQRILQSAAVCRIGMYDGEYPYVLPVNFAYDPEENLLFFHSAKEGKKVDILAGEPRVCIEIDEPGRVIDNGPPCDAEFTYTSLVCRGTAGRCTDTEEQRKGLGLITAKYLEREHTFTDAELQSVAVYKVKIVKISGKRHRRG
jgi:uncharacterized protein